ncbi:hypothetical protein THAOC_33649 [Thalassiosira oceanica]|uniref:Uncharacterized protein n=1 Tax=Thalassiosira oceanica TaxID=159749 RepID=K0RLN3_THAOC|nr:hypothetical protein THAOC_33649 [Thalassiosira oceanica]|eukprot:EJK47617.1 hypothetical protein THAOC_33649 [Thalassiosira oceanica]
MAEDSSTPTCDQAAPYRHSVSLSHVLTASAGSATSTVANPYAVAAKHTGTRPQQPTSRIPTLLPTADAASHPDRSNYAVRPRKRARHNPYAKKKLLLPRQQLCSHNSRASPDPRCCIKVKVTTPPRKNQETPTAGPREASRPGAGPAALCRSAVLPETKPNQVKAGFKQEALQPGRAQEGHPTGAVPSAPSVGGEVELRRVPEGAHSPSSSVLQARPKQSPTRTALHQARTRAELATAREPGREDRPRREHRQAPPERVGQGRFRPPPTDEHRAHRRSLRRRKPCPGLCVLSDDNLVRS